MTTQDGSEELKPSLEELGYELEKTAAQRHALAGALEEVLPTFYGLLCEKWGHPKDWPTYAQGKYAYDKARAILAKDTK